MGNNLLYKASIVTTPTAYGVGVLNSIKPAIPFGEELVVNGSFSNGTTNWTGTRGATLTSAYNVLTVSSDAITYGGAARQVIPTEIGKKYKWDFTINEANDTRVAIYNGTADFGSGTSIIQIQDLLTGSYSYTFTAISSSVSILLGTMTLSGQEKYSNVSVKEKTDADFDFTRTSSATRVNPDYLIETVSINSANLVQNGNFSELGAEAVTNGDFATDSDWNKNSNWTISGGTANCDGSSNSDINQSLALFTPVLGKTYKVSIEITSISQGGIRVSVGGSVTDYYTSIGIYTSYLTTISTDRVRMQPQSSAIGSIDNVSVKQVDPNDNWTLGTGWSIGDGVAKNNGASGSNNLTQSTVVTPNKKYKVAITVSDYVSGNVQVSAGATPRLSITANGTYSVIQTATPTSNLYIIANAFIGSVTNVSVIEIQENGVPRLDYTNGTASILLEPQSTNLLTYSNDFSNSDWTKQSGVTATYNTTETLSPDGTYNATKLVGNGTVGIYSQTAATGLLTRSIYIKSVTGNVNVILKDPAFTTLSKSLLVTTEWQRFELIEDNGQSITSGLWVDDIPSSGIYIYGAQLEALSFATSYIPTSGSTVTRAAETLNNAGNSSLINSTEGVLYAEIQSLTSLVSLNNWLTISDGTTSNYVALVFETTGTTTGRITVGGVGQAYFSITGDYSLNQKLAFKWKENDFAFWINGVEVGTDSVGIVPSADTLNNLQFNYPPGGNNVYGRCKTVAVFKEALSDTELACLTSTNNREIFLNYYYRMQYVGANTEAVNCAQIKLNV